jgi:predicted Zn-dependent protease
MTGPSANAGSNHFIALLDRLVVEVQPTSGLFHPKSAMMNFRVVQAAYYARRYDAAIQSARTAIDLAPDFQPPCAYLASALLATGHTEEAWTMTQKAKRQDAHASD